MVAIKLHRVKHCCIRCGRIVGWTETLHNPYALCGRRGLGDWVDLVLRFVGHKSPCMKCTERKHRLNEFDRKLFRRLRGPRNATYSVE